MNIKSKIALMIRKYVILFLSGCIQGIAWHGFDLPCAINKEFSAYVNILSKKFIIYTFISYAAPNIFTSFIMGYFLNRNINLVGIMGFMIFVGNVLFFMGVKHKYLSVIIIGKILAGIGGEGFTINQNKSIACYFKGKALAQALCFFNILGKVGTMLTYFLAPKFIINYSVIHVLYFSAFLSFIAFISSLLIFFMDRKKINLQQNYKGNRKYDKTFFLYIFTILFFVSAWSTFHNSVIFILRRKFPFDNEKSCMLFGITDILTVILCVLVGYFADHWGHKLSFMKIGYISGFTGILLINLDLGNIFLIMVLSAIGYSFFSCYWACLPSLVNDDTLGMGYAIITCVVNLSYCLPQLITNTFIHKDDDFTYTLTFINVLQFVGFCLILILTYFNSRYKLKLNDSEITKLNE
ncbi:hypothetical protein H311_02239 [Anncaliia algerae PRA109]|nr:hypothetical protein H311_02239 [Anncaliia algerae PRA109]